MIELDINWKGIDQIVQMIRMEITPEKIMELKRHSGISVLKPCPQWRKLDVESNHPISTSWNICKVGILNSHRTIPIILASSFIITLDNSLSQWDRGVKFI